MYFATYPSCKSRDPEMVLSWGLDVTTATQKCMGQAAAWPWDTKMVTGC